MPSQLPGHQLAMDLLPRQVVHPIQIAWVGEEGRGGKRRRRGNCNRRRPLVPITKSLTESFTCWKFTAKPAFKESRTGALQGAKDSFLRDRSLCQWLLWYHVKDHAKRTSMCAAKGSFTMLEIDSEIWQQTQLNKSATILCINSTKVWDNSRVQGAYKHVQMTTPPQKACLH